MRTLQLAAQLSQQMKVSRPMFNKHGYLVALSM